MSLSPVHTFRLRHLVASRHVEWASRLTESAMTFR